MVEYICYEIQDNYHDYFLENYSEKWKFPGNFIETKWKDKFRGNLDISQLVFQNNHDRYRVCRGRNMSSFYSYANFVPNYLNQSAEGAEGLGIKITSDWLTDCMFSTPFSTFLLHCCIRGTYWCFSNKNSLTTSVHFFFLRLSVLSNITIVERMVSDEKGMNPVAITITSAVTQVCSITVLSIHHLWDI